MSLHKDTKNCLSFTTRSLKTKSAGCQPLSAGEQQLEALVACQSQLVSISGRFWEPDRWFNLQFQRWLTVSWSWSLTALNNIVSTVTLCCSWYWHLICHLMLLSTVITWEHVKFPNFVLPPQTIWFLILRCGSCLNSNSQFNCDFYSILKSCQFFKMCWCLPTLQNKWKE